MSARTALSAPAQRERVRALPKVDLHRHLEGSLRLETLAEIAREHGVDLPSHTIEELRPYVQVTDETPNFAGFLEKFKLLRRFYRTPEAIARIAYEAVADAAADNVRYLELRFNPEALAGAHHFSYEDVTDWVIAAVERAQAEHAIQVRLIVAIQRYLDRAAAARIACLAADRMGRGVVALDLLGDEARFPARPYAPIFRDARAAGLHVTVHAGEGAGAVSARDALELLGAERLGHGVRVLEDPDVVALARGRGTVFEVCLTSNLQTGVVTSLAQHPLPQMLAGGLSVTLNTDDPSVSDTTLTDEYLVALEVLSLAPAQLGQMIVCGAQSAFLPAPEREALAAHFRRELQAGGFL